MPEQNVLVLHVALTCVGMATLAQPDQVRLVFDEPMLRSVCKALVSLDALQIPYGRVTIPLGTTDAFTAAGRPWLIQDDTVGHFVVSSLWLHVEPERLHIDVWESHSDDVLDGLIEFSKVPALRTAIERQRRASEEELLMSVCAAPAAGVAETGVADGLTAMLVRALRMAEPWLVKLGDHIGNGTPQDPMGRCNALLAVRRALDRVQDASS
ncbi:MAG: hypothetical protein QM740_20915 [Acidovorax sp.]